MFFVLLTFEPLQPNDLNRLRPYLEAQAKVCPFRVSDNTVGAAFMWRKFLSTAWAVTEEMLIFRITLKNGKQYFTFPIGGNDPEKALDKLEEYCQKNDQPLLFSGVPEPGMKYLFDRYGDRLQYTEWRDSADYLYTADTFLSFPGRHLSGKRNHMRQFYRAHPAAVFRPLTKEDLPKAVQFIREFNARRAATEQRSAIETEEGERSCELIENLFELGLSGGCLEEEGRLLAVSAGEISGDTLFVHIEKGDTRCPGIYQAMSQAFAQYMIREGVSYINREDDAGDEGLRRSKLSYRPCALITKCSVTVGG